MKKNYKLEYDLDSLKNKVEQLKKERKEVEIEPSKIVYNEKDEKEIKPQKITKCCIKNYERLNLKYGSKKLDDKKGRISTPITIFWCNICGKRIKLKQTNGVCCE